jgi:hypothetical protein
MKLSEFKAVSTPQDAEEEALPYPKSDMADPPITRAEALAAEEATCCLHNGRIKTDPLPSDTDGRVYFCPIGRQYWRYKKGGLHNLPPLKYRY